MATTTNETQLVWQALTRPAEDEMTSLEALALFCHASRGMWRLQELVCHTRVRRFLRSIDGPRLRQALEGRTTDVLYEKAAMGTLRYPAAYFLRMVFNTLCYPKDSIESVWHNNSSTMGMVCWTSHLPPTITW